MFGLPKIPMGMLGIADGTGSRPDNTAEDTTALQKLYASLRASNHTPNGRVARGWDQFSPMSGAAPGQPSVPALGGLGLFPPSPTMAASPLQTSVQTPAPLPGNTPPPSAPPPPALSAQAMAPPPAAAPPAVTMPTARPDSAPQAPPPMNFFQRNAAMMQDPSTGAYIDPTNAKRAQSSGPDVINKLLQMFHNKDA